MHDSLFIVIIVFFAGVGPGPAIIFLLARGGVVGSIFMASAENVLKDVTYPSHE